MGTSVDGSRGANILHQSGSWSLGRLPGNFARIDDTRTGEELEVVAPEKTTTENTEDTERGRKREVTVHHTMVTPRPM